MLLQRIQFKFKINRQNFEKFSYHELAPLLVNMRNLFRWEFYTGIWNFIADLNTIKAFQKVLPFKEILYFHVSAIVIRHCCW